MRYTALLKAKEGELVALSKGGIPLGTRILLERNAKVLGPRAQNRLAEVLENAEHGIIALDLSAHPSESAALLARELEAIPKDLRSKVSPVVHPGCSNALQRAACKQARLSGLLVIRMRVRPGVHVRQTLLEFADGLEFDRNRVAVILDFGNLGGLHGVALRNQIIELAGPLAMEAGFESVTVSGTSFPDGVGQFAVNQWEYLERPEFQAWKNAVQSSGIAIGYGDYGPRSASHPPEGFASTVAQVRYTTDEHYCVFRGKLLRNDHQQLRSIGSALTSSALFMGPTYSWGDSELVRIGSGAGGTGNRTTWISIETSHHLTLTAAQVSNALGS